MPLCIKEIRTIAVLLLLTQFSVANSAFIEFEPKNPVEGEIIYYNVGSTPACPDLVVNSINIDENNKVINIASSGASDFVCISIGDNPFILGSLSAGVYTIHVYQFDENLALFSPTLLSLTTQLNVVEKIPTNVFQHETPTSGSIQSGIGLIRGWACSASKIEALIDDKETFLIAYGTSREDTRLNCDDNNNGYGMVINWGVLGSGQHNLKIFIDGVMKIADIDFEVASLSTAFETGLEKQFELQDFPKSGETVILKWIEADQNFKIIQHNK